MNLLKKVGRVVVEHFDVLCIAAGAIGVAITAKETAEAAIKSRDQIKKHEEETGLTLEFKDKLKMTWKNYIWAAIYGLETTGCMIGIKIIGDAKLSKASAAYALLSSRMMALADEKMKELEAPGGDAQNEQKVNLEGGFLIYEPYSQQYILTNKQELLWAELMINKAFANQEFVCLNQLLSFFKNAAPCDFGNSIGWGKDTEYWDWNWSFQPGAPWINFDLAKIDVNGRAVLGLMYGIEPDDIKATM